MQQISKNLVAGYVKLHIRSVWVGTQLKQLLLGVPVALCAIFLGLNMNNEPKCHIIMVHGGQNHQIAFVLKMFTLNT